MKYPSSNQQAIILSISYAANALTEIQYAKNLVEHNNIILGYYNDLMRNLIFRKLSNYLVDASIKYWNGIKNGSAYLE